MVDRSNGHVIGSEEWLRALREMNGRAAVHLDAVWDVDEMEDPDDLYYVDTQWDFESGNPREGW